MAAPQNRSAHRRTDKELSDLEKRIAAEYKKAAEELQDKIDAYFERFKKREGCQHITAGLTGNSEYGIIK